MNIPPLPLHDDYQDQSEFELALWKREVQLMRFELFEEADIAIFKLEDAGADASAWRAYRQALRDLPNTVTEVDVVNLPVKPS